MVAICDCHRISSRSQAEVSTPIPKGASMCCISWFSRSRACVPVPYLIMWRYRHVWHTFRFGLTHILFLHIAVSYLSAVFSVFAYCWTQFVSISSNTHFKCTFSTSSLCDIINAIDKLKEFYSAKDGVLPFNIFNDFLTLSAHSKSLKTLWLHMAVQFDIATSFLVTFASDVIACLLIQTYMPVTYQILKPFSRLWMYSRFNRWARTRSHLGNWQIIPSLRIIDVSNVHLQIIHLSVAICRGWRLKFGSASGYSVTNHCHLMKSPSLLILQQHCPIPMASS